MKKFLIFLTCLIFPLLAIAAVPQQTVANLNKAMQDEANASHKYQLYAQKAEKEGYPQVAKLFRAISTSEFVHFNNHKSAISALGGKPEPVKYREIQVGTTRENIARPITGETKEAESVYPQYIQQARQDGAEQAVNSFTYAMNSEKQHESLLKNALANLGSTTESDYCVNKTTGETKEVFPYQKCTEEPDGTKNYIRISQ